MPHVHGVAWIEKTWLENFGITGTLVDHPDKVPELADRLISCQLPDDPNLRKTVEEVQTHHHTKSCQKFSLLCRYGYPKLPSPKTIIARPLPKDMNKHEKEKLMKEATETLAKAKEILEDPKSASMSFEEYFAVLGVSEEQYLKYIGISERGKILVSKRGLNETFVNNFNTEWITAWNANMDIQLALDPYAVITYIVNYVSKDETGITKFLQETLRAKAYGKLRELLKALQSTYLTNRQMGLPEAVYKALCGMRLRDSNVTCINVATGFPENRSLFYKKVVDDKGDEIPLDEEELDDEIDDGTSSKPIKIEGREGTYQAATTIHDRYAARPDRLELMCLAQFATHYTYTKKVPKDTTFDDDGNSVDSSETGQKMFNSEVSLPKYISLEESGLGFMRLRMYPSVLRFHNSKKKEGHEKQYSEMLLFSHWRDEVKDLHRFDAKECIEAYQERREELTNNRKVIFPGEEILPEMCTNLYDNQVLQERPTHIYDALNSQGEQDQDDDIAEGEESDPKYESLGYFGNLGEDSENIPDDVKYKKINVPSKEEMEFLTHRLVPEQLVILKKVVSYCKDILKFNSNKMHKVSPLRIIIHGGSGI